MPWVKIDDQMPDHPKIMALSDAAFRAHVTAICYAARNLTDGFLPLRKAKEFANQRAVKELVPLLWEPAEGGFSVHDYLQYQPPRAQVMAEREAAKARMFAKRSPEHPPNFAGNSPSPDPTPTPDPIPDPVPREVPTPTPTPRMTARALPANQNGGKFAEPDTANNHEQTARNDPAKLAAAVQRLDQPSARELFNRRTHET